MIEILKFYETKYSSIRKNSNTFRKDQKMQLTRRKIYRLRGNTRWQGSWAFDVHGNGILL